MSATIRHWVWRQIFRLRCHLARSVEEIRARYDENPY
jgi:hypothetical protein